MMGLGDKKCEVRVCEWGAPGTDVSRPTCSIVATTWGILRGYIDHPFGTRIKTPAYDDEPVARHTLLALCGPCADFLGTTSALAALLGMTERGAESERNKILHTIPLSRCPFEKKKYTIRILGYEREDGARVKRSTPHEEDEMRELLRSTGWSFEWNPDAEGVTEAATSLTAPRELPPIDPLLAAVIEKCEDDPAWRKKLEESYASVLFGKKEPAR